MSAFLCSQDHLNLIVNSTPIPSENMFNILLQENLRSLAARYGEGTDKNCASDYAFEEISPSDLIARVYSESDSSASLYPAIKNELTEERVIAQIRKACDCYEYQACETDDYKQTLAARLIDLIRDTYPENEKLENEAIWGI